MHLLPGCKLVVDSALGVEQLAELVAALEEARTRGAAVQTAGDHLIGGGSLPDLYRALLIANCRQLSFDPLGFVAHSLWVVAPALELGRRGNAADAVVAALHAVDLFKLEQRVLRGDERAQPGVLGALPVADPAALEDAILTGDADGADVAAVALYRTGDLDLLRATLGRASLQNLGNIGHFQIHAAQTLRALDELGWDETVVRVLAWALGRATAGEFAILDTWEPNRLRADALPLDWDAGADDVAGAWALVSQLRSQDPEVASSAVAAALTAGLSVASVFDALEIRASELALSQIGRDGVFPGFHTLTGLESFRWLLASAPDDNTRRLAVLQAAAMVAENDAEGDARAGGQQGDVRLDELERIPGATAEEVLATAGNDRLEAAGQLLALVNADGMESFVAAQLQLALRTSIDEHNFKLPVAAWLLAEAAPPELRGAVLAGSLSWGSTGIDRDWDQLDRAMDIAAAVS